MTTMTRPITGNWVEIVEELGQGFAALAPAHDASDTFVADNVEALRAQRVLSAGVPIELGGGGAEHAELCAMLRALGRHCSSTALVLSMHTHLVATAAWRWRHHRAPVEPLLRRVADQELVLISTGGADWLASSGTAVKVDGGYRISARKSFASGVPAGHLLVTSAVAEEPPGEATVLHFALPLDAPGVSIETTWQALGMRGTGSHDVVLRDVFVADAVISGRRPRGRWHPLLHAVSLVALPLIYAVYVGLAEAARAIALDVAGRRAGEDTPGLAGEMQTELTAAQIALESMVALAATAMAGPETTAAMLTRRALVARAAVAAVGKAMELAGGRAFYRAGGLERLWRDVQAARYHPVPDPAQRRYAGRLALGLGPDG